MFKNIILSLSLISAISANSTEYILKDVMGDNLPYGDSVVCRDKLEVTSTDSSLTLRGFDRFFDLDHPKLKVPSFTFNPFFMIDVETGEKIIINDYQMMDDSKYHHWVDRGYDHFKAKVGKLGDLELIKEGPVSKESNTGEAIVWGLVTALDELNPFAFGYGYHAMKQDQKLHKFYSDSAYTTDRIFSSTQVSYKSNKSDGTTYKSWSIDSYIFVGLGETDLCIDVTSNYLSQVSSTFTRTKRHDFKRSYKCFYERVE